jgi:hypothetical protein
MPRRHLLLPALAVAVAALAPAGAAAAADVVRGRHGPIARA